MMDFYTDLSEVAATLLEEPGTSRSHLLEEITDAICDQGAIYDAEACLVVPSLFTFLPQALPEDKISVLYLLGFLIEERRKQFPTAEESFRESPLYRMLCEGLPIYRELFTSEDREIRALCAFLLGYCRSETVDIPGYLKVQYQHESDERVQFALIKALTILQAFAKAELAELFRTTTSFVIRHVLSLAIAQVEGDETPAAVEGVLLEGLLNPEALEPAYADAPYPTSALTALLDAIASFRPQRRLQLLTTAIERFHVTSPTTFLNLMEIIEHCFQFAEFPQEVNQHSVRWITPLTCKLHYRVRPGVRSEPLALTDLTEAQSQVLLCLLRCEDFWRQKTNFLEVYTLPTTREALTEFLQRA